jgi:hypothetical protein
VLDFSPPDAPWLLSRTIVASPHRERILERTTRVRRFFPELDGVTIRLGLARKRGVLGWGSLDPDAPGIWVRPRRLDHFTIAHELTHLLQARGLVPRGERACDLFALTRSPLVIDHPPSYLKLPAALRAVDAPAARALHAAACDAVQAHARGVRQYIRRFERSIADWAAAHYADTENSRGTIARST